MTKDYKRHNRSATFDQCQSACQNLLSNTQRRKSITPTSSWDEKLKLNNQQNNDKRFENKIMPIYTFI